MICFFIVVFFVFGHFPRTVELMCSRVIWHCLLIWLQDSPDPNREQIVKLSVSTFMFFFILFLKPAADWCSWIMHSHNFKWSYWINVCLVLSILLIIPFRPSWARCPSEGSAPPTQQMISVATISTATMLSKVSETTTCNPWFPHPPIPRSAPPSSIPLLNDWEDKDYKLSWAEPSRAADHAGVWFCKIVASSWRNRCLKLSFNLWRCPFFQTLKAHHDLVTIIIFKLKLFIPMLFNLSQHE